MRRLLLITIFAVCTLGALARPYRVEDIPNVQIENRYCFTSNPDGILSREAVASMIASFKVFAAVIVSGHETEWFDRIGAKVMELKGGKVS